MLYTRGTFKTLPPCRSAPGVNKIILVLNYKLCFIQILFLPLRRKKQRVLTYEWHKSKLQLNTSKCPYSFSVSGIISPKYELESGRNESPQILTNYFHRFRIQITGFRCFHFIGSVLCHRDQIFVIWSSQVHRSTLTCIIQRCFQRAAQRPYYIDYNKQINLNSKPCKAF